MGVYTSIYIMDVPVHLYIYGIILNAYMHNVLAGYDNSDSLD